MELCDWLAWFLGEQIAGTMRSLIIVLREVMLFEMKWMGWGGDTAIEALRL